LDLLEKVVRLLDFCWIFVGFIFFLGNISKPFKTDKRRRIICFCKNIIPDRRTSAHLFKPHG